MCCLLLATVPARGATLTFNFDDGTLQGWHNRVWDLSANGGAGAWVDLEPNVSAMPSTINGGAIAPASGNNNLFGSNGTQVDPVGGNTDTHLNTLWLRSPEFILAADADLTVQLARGKAHGLAPANDASVAFAANSTTGWKGVALRRASDGAFVLSQPRIDEGDAMVTVTFSAAELAPYAGVRCTLELINSENGSWGWLSMDNVSIPGVGTQVMLAKADPALVVGINSPLSVSLPEGANAASAVTVYVTNSNPAALSVNGSTASVVPVVFAAGAASSVEVPLLGVAPGSVQLKAGAAGLGSSVTVSLGVYPKLIGRWLSGAPNLAETSGFRATGTHDGVAVGNASALVYSSDLPPGGTGQSLDLRTGDVGVSIANSATSDTNYQNTYDDVIRRKFTISFWAKGFPASWNGWVSKRGEDGIGWQLRRMSGDPIAGFTIRGIANDDGWGSTINVNDAAWHHYVGVWDQASASRTLYVDGVLSHVLQNTAGQMMTMAPGKHLALGAREQSGTGYESFFSGMLYDVRLHSYALSEAEVAALLPAIVTLSGRPAVAVGGSSSLTVGIPAGANASSAVTVNLANSQPGRLTINGSSAATVPVVFAAGAANSQPVTLGGASAGLADITATASGLGGASLTVQVFTSGVAGLIGHWVAGAPHLADISGYSDGTHDGTFVGTPTGSGFNTDVPPGASGYSLDLRGPGGTAVRINNTRSADAAYQPTFDDGIASKFTVAFWAKGFPDTWNPWVSKYGEDGKGWQLRRYGGNSVSCFTIRGLSNEDGTGSTISVNDNNWHHFVGVWDGDNGLRSLYVDGMLSHTITGNFAPMGMAANSHMMLGARSDESAGYSAWFEGLLYDVRMYNSALSDTDVLDLIGTVLTSPASLSLSAPSPNTNFITIVVPPSAVAANSVTVVVTSDKPAVASPVGAVGGVLSVTLPKGGANSTTFAVQANGPGTARFTYSCTTLAALTTTVVAVQQPNINGLVAYWSFDNQNLAETGGFQPAGVHDGQAVGNVAFVPGRLGGYALDLRATDTAVRVMNSTVNDAEYRPTFDSFMFGSPYGFSWTCWVKGLPVTDWAAWIAKDGEAAGYAIRKAGGSNLTFTLRNSTGVDDPTTPEAVIKDDIWHHVAAVYDPVALQRRLYIDGVELINIADGELATPATGMPLYFGSRDSSGDPRFGRVIVDEIRAYDAALTPADITAQVGLPMISMTPGKANMNLGDPDVMATITVPPSMLATGAVSVTVASANPAVAMPLGGAAGKVTIQFAMGGVNTATLPLRATGIGATVVSATSPSGVVNGETVFNVTAAPVLVGRWFSGLDNLADVSGYRPAGTHDGQAAGNNADLLTYSPDVPPNFTGYSLDLNAGNVGVRVANSSSRDAGYQPTFDSDIAGNFSVAFWAKGMPGEWAGWVTKYGENGRGWQLRRMGTDNIAGFTIRGVDNEDGWGSAINVNNGDWHHFVGIWDQASGSRRLYVDGVYSHTVNNNPAQVISQAPGAHLVFGALEDENGGLWDGRYVSCMLFDVRIYQYALSDYRIQSLQTPSVDLPELTVQSTTGNQIRISWPASYTGFVLEKSADPVTGWGPSGLTITQVGTENVALAPNSAAQQFFRLKQ